MPTNTSRKSHNVPDEALMALTLDDRHSLPSGTIRYAPLFGVW
ncbi:hypothetical protein OG563_38310 [Nocardia vinacea]|uniref:Transposase n=1 Tax=Nocardia vinacea TaxID=96468 RepID=A0ABZ1YRN4_9NOCA|nr:hypothetical protein [Nocardia vinacea]